MNIRIDPLNESGMFDSKTYELENYEDLKKAAMRYIVTEGFDRERGEYNISILGQNWYVKVQ